jgi:hypothetical protein
MYSLSIYAVLLAFTTLSAATFGGRSFRAFTTGGSTWVVGPRKPAVSRPQFWQRSRTQPGL